MKFEVKKFALSAGITATAITTIGILMAQLTLKVMEASQQLQGPEGLPIQKMSNLFVENIPMALLSILLSFLYAYVAAGLFALIYNRLCD